MHMNVAYQLVLYPSHIHHQFVVQFIFLLNENRFIEVVLHLVIYVSKQYEKQNREVA